MSIQKIKEVLDAQLAAFEKASIASSQIHENSQKAFLEPFYEAAKKTMVLLKMELEDLVYARTDGLTPTEAMLADEGKKIQAIKAHRERTGMGLKESKEAVEAYMNSTPQARAEARKEVAEWNF